MTPLNVKKIIRRNMEEVKLPVYLEDIVEMDRIQYGFFRLLHKCGEVYYFNIKDLGGSGDQKYATA